MKSHPENKNFNPRFYRQYNRDLITLDENELEKHYEEHGIYEGRLAHPVNLLSLNEEGSDERHNALEKLSESSVVIVSHDSSLTGAPVVACNLAITSSVQGLKTSLIVFGAPDNALRDLLRKSDKDNLNVIEISHANRTKIAGAAIGEYIVSSFISLISNSIETCLFTSGIISARPDLYDRSVILVHEHPHNYNARWLEQAALAAKHIVFSSNFIRDSWERVAIQDGHNGGELYRNSHIIRQPVQIISNTSKHRQEKISRKYFRRPATGSNALIKIIGAGYVQYRKGVDTFIRCALNYAKEHRHIGISAIWIGKIDYSDYFGQTISSLIRECAPASNLDIRIMKPFKEYREAIIESDLVLFPARFDPLPNFILDCMDCGKVPILAKGATGFDELYADRLQADHCRNLLVSDLDLTHHLHEIIEEYLANRVKHAEKSTKMAAEILRDFPSQETYLSQILELVNTHKESTRQPVVSKNFYDVKTSDMEPRASSTGSKYVFHIAKALTHWGLNPLYESPTAAKAAMAAAYRKALVNRRKKVKPLSEIYDKCILQKSRAANATEDRQTCDLHIHCHYQEGLNEMLTEIEPGTFEMIHITYTDAKPDLSTKAARHNIELTKVENKGRNIVPLLTIAEGLGADYILHMHIKRSAHNASELVMKWNQFLKNCLLGWPRHSDRHTQDILAVMKGNMAGIAFPLDQHRLELGKNAQLLNQLCGLGQCNGRFSEKDHFPFPVGSMFYASTSYITSLKEEAIKLLCEQDIGEPIADDGTLLHAIERYFALHAAATGEKILLLDSYEGGGRGPRQIGI